MAEAGTFAYKHMPTEVLQPIMQMLGWLLWLVLLLCLAWMILSAGRFWSQFRGGNLLDNDAAHGVFMSMIGALVATSATGIALVLLPS
jgi:hypothetical protein